MRDYVVGIVLLGMVGSLFGDSPDEPVVERVARLIRQLGHDKFAKREAESKELDALGKPALGALRKAAASHSDLEIRRRAERIIQSISERLHAAAARKELQRLAGTWTLVKLESNGSQVLGE